MDINPSTLLNDLRARVDDPSKKLLVENLALDVTRVATMALVDPAAAQREIGFVRASAANLTAAEATAVQNLILTWVAKVLQAAIIG